MPTPELFLDNCRLQKSQEGKRYFDANSTLLDRTSAFLKPRPKDHNTSTQHKEQHYWPSVCKPRPNDGYVSTKHITTLLGATCWVHLVTLLWRVATCWVLPNQTCHGTCPGLTCCTNLAKRVQHHATSTNVAWKIWPFSNLSEQHPTCRIIS